MRAFGVACRAWGESPHVASTEECDADRTLRARCRPGCSRRRARARRLCRDRRRDRSRHARTDPSGDAAVHRRRFRRSRRVRRHVDAPYRWLDPAVAQLTCADPEPDRARCGRQRVGARDDLPPAPDADHRHRAGRIGAGRAPRPVGIRFLPVPEGLRGAVQHDLGDDRLPRGERRDARDSGQQPLRRQARVRNRGHRVCRDGCGLGARLHGLAVPRRRPRIAATKCGWGSTSPTRSRGCARKRTSI